MNPGALVRRRRARAGRPRMNVALLVNPAARAGRAHRRGDARGRAPARARHARPRSSAAAAPPSRRDLLRTAIELGTDAVVVAGGDGTVNLALQELAGTGIPLGIVPVGHRQRLRRAPSGCSELDVAAAADVDRGRAHAAHRPRPRHPRATARRTYFGSVLASGFDSKVNDRANAMRWPRGGSRYNIAILVEFLTLAGIPYEVELELADGTRERVDGDLVMATVGNGAHLRRRHPDLSRRRPRRRAARRRRWCARPAACACCGCCRASTRARTRRCPRCRSGACARCGSSSPGVTAYADGDPIGALPLTIDVVPGAR